MAAVKTGDTTIIISLFVYNILFTTFLLTQFFCSLFQGKQNGGRCDQQGV